MVFSESHLLTGIHLAASLFVFVFVSVKECLAVIQALAKRNYVKRFLNILLRPKVHDSTPPLLLLRLLLLPLLALLLL